MASLTRRRREAELQRTLAGVVAARQRAPLPVALWNWRRELTILAAALLLTLAVANTLGVPWLIVVLSAMTGLLWPPWSKRFSGLLWAMATPHLLRSGLYHAGIQNRHGRLPLIVRVTREPFGERVRLRCPPGTCAEDLWYNRDILRAACRARDVRVIRDEWRAHMITVDVIRHPLGDNSPGNDHRELAA